MLLLPLSSALLQVIKTVLTTSTHLLKKSSYSFFWSLLMSSTAILTEMKSDSLQYLAVLSLNRISISVTQFLSYVRITQVSWVTISVQLTQISPNTIFSYGMELETTNHLTSKFNWQWTRSLHPEGAENISLGFQVSDLCF